MKSAKNVTKLLATLICAALPLALNSAPTANRGENKKANKSFEQPDEFRNKPTGKITNKNFGPHRTTPVFKGAFQVDLVVIAFPDCEMPEPEEVREALNRIRGSTIVDYYKEYSQGITWPELAVYPKVYVAPHPLGYYCKHDSFINLIGWGGIDDGGQRAGQLRRDALAFVQKNGRLSKTGQVTCYVYCRKIDRRPGGGVERAIKPLYLQIAGDKMKREEKNMLRDYNPPIRWSDPLWPNSIPQVHYPSDGGTIVHELGHVLGAPDFYHATENYDGMPGDPSLPWAWGPTGPAYCRAIYQAFVPISSYPTYTKSGTYTLNPRSSKAEDGVVLGCFLPAAHPNYMFHLEYVHNETNPIGAPSHDGLLIHLINVTMSSPMMGPPDMCYTYRPGDPYFRARGKSDPYFHDGDSFTAETDPKAVLPNFLPAGLEIPEIHIADGKATFTVEFKESNLSQKQLADSLVPQIKLEKVDEIMPTSLRAHADVTYRGEPLLTEYGFCYGFSLHPVLGKDANFPLFHRDRYDARIIDLKPGGTYFIRAYAKSERGVFYSKSEKKVTLPKPEDITECPPLITDNFIGNFFITRWHFQVFNGVQDTANALITMMSIGNYYRTLPGGSGNKGGRNRDGINMDRVHTHPTLSRPDFRMAEEEALRGRMGRLVHECRMKSATFGDKSAEWVKNCARVLKIQPKAFVKVDKYDIESHAGEIKEWLLKSQPVLLLRESTVIKENTDVKYPLDFAIIDGFSADGEFHSVFPLGHDRQLSTRSGYHSLESLCEYVSEAYLIFYRP